MGITDSGCQVKARESKPSWIHSRALHYRDLTSYSLILSKCSQQYSVTSHGKHWPLVLLSVKKGINVFNLANGAKLGFWPLCSPASSFSLENKSPQPCLNCNTERTASQKWHESCHRAMSCMHKGSQRSKAWQMSDDETKRPTYGRLTGHRRAGVWALYLTSRVVHWNKRHTRTKTSLLTELVKKGTTL